MITENGWPSCGPDMLDRSPIPGIELVIPLQRGQPSAILKAYCADYHLFVESLYNSRGGTDEGGWTPTNSVATSNHLGGTAVDLNWDDHAFQVRGTFSRDQMTTLRELLDYYEDTVFWAGDWDSPVDEMHHQMGYGTYQNPHTQDFIDRKIRSDGFSFFRKAADVTGPERKPVIPSDGGTYWADVSQYQKRPVDETYPYGALSFRSNSGDKTDALAAKNCASALEALESGGSDLIIVYYYYKSLQANVDLHREILEENGLWLHDGVVSMVDVEPDPANKGDQSGEVNEEISRLRGWYGDQKRVCGYFNPNASPGLWLHRPYALPLIIPQYNNRPGDLSGVQNEIARREAFAHQFTDAAMDVAPWTGSPVDMNWSPLTIAEMLTLFGLRTEIKEPDVGGALDLSAADIEELCGAIGAQFLA